MVHYKHRLLYFADHCLSDLVTQHKTPLYVYCEAIIQERLQKYLQAFAHKADIHFAMKCNSHPHLLKMMKKQNVGVDVVSMGEIKQAFAAGFRPSDVIFSGVAKTQAELQFAIENAIKQINVESPQELERIGMLTQKLNKPVDIAFRYNPDVSPDTHPHITTGFRENKFGMDASFVPELEHLLAKYPQVHLKGMTLHIGSQILDIAVFKEAILKTIPIYQHFQSLGFEMGRFDIGGGLGISYHQGQKSPDVMDYGHTVQQILAPLSCRILCEPGRAIMGSAGVLLTQVQYIKRTPFKNFAMVDTGMHHLLRPALYNAHHKILPLKQEDDNHKALWKVYDVVGPICESADVLGKSRTFQELKQGDVLAILDVGAYGASMASGYNSHPFPKEVFIPHLQQ